METRLQVIGGGLAGCEAAWQAARRGIEVDLYEMRPAIQTGAHTGGDLAELVCSNSLGTKTIDRPSGLLKEELRRLDSLLLRCANESAVPAGDALAVDRVKFSASVSNALASNPRIHVIREEVRDIPMGYVIVASGPLTSPSLCASIQALTGENNLFFFDAIAPIVSLASVDLNIAFRSSRFQKIGDDEGDYINCPMNREEYFTFARELIKAQRIPLRDFEQNIDGGVRAGNQRFFEGCLPIEVLASRGENALAFGPMRPIGLRDPRTGRRPHAVAQLRQDDLSGELYNIVGFQTNLTFPEQDRIIHLIPGLEHAEIVRHGQMHRNTFIASPAFLQPTLQFNNLPDLFFAGQITGVEGYLGNIATGLLAGWNAARVMQGKSALKLPLETMIGGLCHYITHADVSTFQPAKAMFGLLPSLVTESKSKRERSSIHVERALRALDVFIAAVNDIP